MTQKIFHDDLIEEIRVKYGIEYKFKPFLITSYTFDFIRKNAKDIQVYRYLDRVDVIAHQTTAEKLNRQTEICKIVGTDFYAVEACVSGLMDEPMYIKVVFTENISAFYQKYLKSKMPRPKPFELKSGVYKPRRGRNGWTLDKIELKNVMKPILNHNLYDVLTYEIEAFLKNEKIYKNLGVDYKRGIMLYGDAGCGKTSFIKNLLKERTEAVSVLMDSQNGDLVDFMEWFLGVKDFMDFLKIIVIEDIDGMPEQCRSEFLNFLDGVKPIHKTIFISTTNFPDKVDIALKDRPSRFDSVYKIGKPNAESRRQLLQHYFKEFKPEELKKNGKAVTMLEKCISASKGFAGAYYKEFYIMSKLNKSDALGAIEEIKRRRKLLDKQEDTGICY